MSPTAAPEETAPDAPASLREAPDGSAEWLVPKPGVFDDVRAIDGAWLEKALEGSAAEVSYQHGLDEMKAEVASGKHTAGVLIRTTSLDEIMRTAREGLLMPPKSTWFEPTLADGLVSHVLD